MKNVAFTITPFGMRVFEKMEEEGCTLDQAIWKTQKEDGVSLLKRVRGVVKGFLIGFKHRELGSWGYEK